MTDGQLTHDGNTIWTVARAAREAGLTTAAIQALIDNGTLAAAKIGTYVFCSKTQIDALP